MVEQDEVVVQAELSREERDREGFRNAIVISDSDDEGASSRPAAAVKKTGAASSSSSTSCNSAGKRPATADPDDVKPDVKQIKPAPAVKPQAHHPFHGAAAGALQPTDLEDLSFANPVKFAHGRGPAAPRRAGFLMVRLSAQGGAADPPVLIGTGREATSVQLLDVLPYEVTLSDGTHGNQVWSAIRRLADPRNTAPSRYRQGQPLIHVELQPPLPWRLKRSQPPVQVRLDVWLMPGIFDLRISTWHSCASCFYDIWLLFDKLTPMVPFIEPPRPPPVKGEVALAPCGAASASRPISAAVPKATAHSFTLAGLMRAMESAGYDEMADPPGLQLTLYPFQRQSLQWMFDRETQEGGLNALFWREYPSDKGGGDDHTFWYNPMAGELRDHKLPMVTGGFLCEEMGLGKTVEMCALVLANPYTARASAAGRAMVRRSAASPPTPTKATLVICPVVLLNQWKAEISKCAGSRLKVYVHHSDAARKENNRDLTPFLDADVVLTTYEVLRAEVPWTWSFRAILRMHWWRVVLDESQKVPKPTNERSAMTAIAKACADLSRTHTWCMSGTPVGSVVDDLLGQLMVLGVEPYCSRGDNGDAWWEREVTERWKARDKDALEVVHDLLGQIMMRHSKEQTMGSADGQRTALVELPAKTEDVMLVPLADASERVVYGELERMSREDFLAGEAAKAALAKAIASGSDPVRVNRLRKVAQQFSRDDLVSPRDLQHVATHVSALNLDKDVGIERKLVVRAARTGAASTKKKSAAAAPHTVFGPMLLRDAAAAATGGTSARLHALLSKPDAHRCGICKGSFRANEDGIAGSSSDEAPRRLVPRLTPCGHLFCQSCLGNSQQQRGDEACPECFAPDAGLRSAMLLATPLDAASLDEADTAATEPSLPAVETSAWEIATPPPVAQLRELRVWSCDGQPCHDDGSNNGALSAAKKAKAAAIERAQARGATRAEANRAGCDAEAAYLAQVGFVGNGKKERQVTLDVDGMHFCSQVCAEAKFKRALIKENGLLVVGDEWDGDKLNGRQFPNQSQALKALKEVIRAEPSYVTGTQWAGDALYPSLQREDAAASNAFTDAETNGRSQRLPNLANFPPEAPDGAFLAHLDAAGGPRSYGMHWPCYTGSKAVAALEEIERVHAAGEKIVVFSDCKPVLEVMHEAIRRKLGDGSVAFIFGDTAFDNRMQALRRFNENVGCYTLLLSVGACASGLTLTAANHCLLLDLQSHEGRELQLINRVWRIGQTRPVSVKRMVAAGTIEERMLHLRKRSKGLMATESDADTMTVSRVDEGVESSTAEQSERTEELRYLFNATV